MTTIYVLIGKAVVAFVRRRIGKQIGIAAGAALGVGIIAAYLLASRDVEEG